MAFNYSPKVVTDGLVLYLDAANTKSYISGSTTWSDLSRSGLTAALQNGPTFNSGNSGYLSFDGTNDRGVIPRTNLLSPGTGDFTFSCWIYPNAWPNNIWSPIFVTALTNGIWIGQDNANQFVLRAYAVANRIQYSTRPTLNTWTQVVITRIGTTATLYYNAISQTTATTNQNFVQGTTYIANDSSTEYYNGRISNLLFYKGKGLSATEILQNYNATKTRFGL